VRKRSPRGTAARIHLQFYPPGGPVHILVHILLIPAFILIFVRLIAGRNLVQPKIFNLLQKYMKSKTIETTDVSQLVEDAQDLLTATAHIAEEKVMAARKRLSGAVQNGREVLDNLKNKAIDGAKATDEVIREHPYESMGVALGVGVLIGLLLRRRN
jgi:ElaB/YqjD/DUF883 family membrane-anchored ribosome-binding protein